MECPCPSLRLGWPGAGRMMRAGGARQRFRSALLEEPSDFEPFGPHLPEIELRRAIARDDDEVDPAWQQIGVGPEALAAEAFDPVSFHGAADSPTHDQPEPRRPRPALGREEKREMRRSDAPGVAVSLRARELRVLAEPAIGAEGHHARDRMLKAGGDARLLLVEGRHEPLAALAASVVEHLAATGRGHAGAKAVRARAADVVGLVGAFHRVPRFRRDKRASDRRPVKCLGLGICWYGRGAQ
jgi:hypothetical protein